MKKLVYILSIIFPLLWNSCGLDENKPYDLKFIHIMHNEASTVNVSSKANFVATYNVYLSAPASNETVNVTYEITSGDGLQENVDYKIITTGNTLTFLPGIYNMPIRIEWMARPQDNPLDPNKYNTLKIRLISNDKGYSIGLPGPAHNQSVLTIIKV